MYIFHCEYKFLFYVIRTQEFNLGHTDIIDLGFSRTA